MKYTDTVSHLLNEYLELKQQYTQACHQYLVNNYVGQYIFDKNTNAYMHVTDTNLMSSEKKFKTFSGPCIFFINDGFEIQYEDRTDAFIFEGSLNEETYTFDGLEIVSKESYIDKLKKSVDKLEEYKNKALAGNL